MLFIFVKFPYSFCEQLCNNMISCKYTNIYKAIDFTNEAVELQNNKKYEESFAKYKTALGYWNLAIKCLSFFIDIVIITFFNYYSILFY